jgi:hypothetical protein
MIFLALMSLQGGEIPVISAAIQYKAKLLLCSEPWQTELSRPPNYICACPRTLKIKTTDVSTNDQICN